MQQCPFILLYLHDFHPEIEQQQNPQLATMQPYSVSKKISFIIQNTDCFVRQWMLSLI